MAGTFLSQIDPTKVNPWGTLLTNGQQAVATSGAQVGEGGVTGDTSANGYAVFAPGAKRGDTEGLYDTSGKLTGTQQIRGDSFDLGEFAKGAAFVGAFALGANALFGGASGAAEAGSTAAYTSPGEVDATLAEQTAAGGGVTPDTMLTGNYMSPGEVDQSLAQQSMEKAGGYMSPGEADQSLAQQTAGEGGVRGAPADATSAEYRNGSDMQSDIATETGVAPQGAVNEGVATGGEGAYWNTSPLQAGGGPFDWLKDLVKPLTGGNDIGDAIKTGVGITSLLTGLTSPKPTAQAPQTPKTPEQPLVGAGGSAYGSAQGGASGSLAGVAGTLLTAKDTFGYGKSMVG
jgi:hypothetical protein